MLIGLLSVIILSFSANSANLSDTRQKPSSSLSEGMKKSNLAISATLGGSRLSGFWAEKLVNCLHIRVLLDGLGSYAFICKSDGYILLRPQLGEYCCSLLVLSACEQDKPRMCNEELPLGKEQEPCTGAA